MGNCQIRFELVHQSILKEARTDAKGTDKAEQKSVCDDVVNFEG